MSASFVAAILLYSYIYDDDSIDLDLYLCDMILIYTASV